MSEKEKLRVEDDPGAPEGIIAPSGVEAANRGVNGRGDLPDGIEMPGTTEGPPGPPTVVAVDIVNAQAFLDACMTSHPRVGYGLGAKVRAGQVPGRDFTAVDCSGFVREAIRRSTDLANRFPDGSVVQHDWVRGKGFERVDRSEAGLMDDGVRIAFLSPGDSPSGIGHVVLLHRGHTLESHGGVGPNSRAWTGTGWQGKASVYVLMPAD